MCGARRRPSGWRPCWWVHVGSRDSESGGEEVQEMAAGFKSKLGVSNQVREVFSTRDRPPMRVACWPPLATHLQAQQRSFTTRASIAVTYS